MPSADQQQGEELPGVRHRGRRWLGLERTSLQGRGEQTPEEGTRERRVSMVIGTVLFGIVGGLLGLVVGDQAAIGGAVGGAVFGCWIGFLVPIETFLMSILDF